MEKLVGRYHFLNGEVVPDECEREIEARLKDCLVLIKTSPDGWSRLYKDELRGGFCELTFEVGSMHGGGPRTLTYGDFCPNCETFVRWVDCK